MWPARRARRAPTVVWSASALTQTSSLQVPATRSRASIRSPGASRLAPLASSGRPTAKTLCVVIQGSASAAWRAAWTSRSPVMSQPCRTSSSRMCSANQGTFMVRPVQATSVSAGTSSAATATSFRVAIRSSSASHRSASLRARSGASRSSKPRVPTGSPSRCAPSTRASSSAFPAWWMTMSRTVHASHQVPASGRRCCTASTNGCHSGNRSWSIVVPWSRYTHGRATRYYARQARSSGYAAKGA